MRVKLSSFEALALGAWFLLAAVSGLTAAGILSLSFMENNVPLCLFRLLTDVPCPGCGMMHALIFAFQGRWAESWAHHPLGVPLLGLWTAWVANGSANILRGSGFSRGFPVFRSGAAGVSALAGIFAIYALRT